MSDALEHVRYSCGIAGEEVANYVDQLQAKIAEFEEENAKLIREVVNRNQRALDGDKAVKAADALYEQLAAEQLNNKLLLKALEFLNARIVTMDLGGVVERAISLPASTEALDAYVAEKVKEATATQKEYYEGVFQDGSKQIAKAFRRRDLAVEALEKWDMFFGGDAETAVLTIAEDPSTLTGCQKATKEAMSAIKESEAK